MGVRPAPRNEEEEEDDEEISWRLPGGSEVIATFLNRRTSFSRVRSS
jgi:hypothetical protein